ncbi:MAG: agmatine deiminase [Lachnospiraceae bacterium]|nr:agmatine deiminase [Lachnospiraceae bacterium]
MAYYRKQLPEILTTPMEDGFHMPGEFEPHRGCVMVWPVRPGSWPHGAKDAQRTFIEIARAIARSETVWMLAAPEQIHTVQEALAAPEQMHAVQETFAGGEDEGGRQEFEKADIGQKPKKAHSGRNAKDGASGSTCVSSCGIACAPNIYLLPVETDDAWARDIGPTCVVRKNGEVRGIDWNFNAWGGKVDGLYAHWDKDNQAAGAICRALGMECYDARHFVLEGGAIHSDGEGTVLVTEACLLSPGRNPHMTKARIEDTLKSYLGAQKVIWLPRGIWNDETNEHVDNVSAFVRPGEVVLAWTDDKNDPQWSLSNASLRVLEQERDARGRNFIIHKLPIPAKPVCITEEDLAGFVFEDGEDTREAGERLAASYVNFYISNGAVIVPQFGDENDAQAVRILAGLFPEREIIPIYTRPVIVGGGNIHCITQQIPGGE